MNKKTFARASLALLGTAFLGVALTAQAAATPKTCTVTAVFYDNARVKFSCSDGTVNYGLTTCGTASISVDTLKVWASLGQGALLAGKRLNLVYESSSSASCIYSTELIP